jgi:D-glycero-alpha-D-manno-heptose-7-phosphate kinase
MIIRSKAPLRLSLAGGVPMFHLSDLYGGAILNITLSLYAHASIEATNDGRITFIDPEEATVLLITRVIVFRKKIPGAFRQGYTTGSCGNSSATAFVQAYHGPGCSCRIGVGNIFHACRINLGAFAEWLELPLGNTILPPGL